MGWEGGKGSPREAGGSSTCRELLVGVSVLSKEGSPGGRRVTEEQVDGDGAGRDVRVSTCSSCHQRGSLSLIPEHKGQALWLTL